MRDRLIKLVDKQSCPSLLFCDKNCKYAHLEERCYAERVADHLLANGAIVPPFKVKVGNTAYFVIEDTVVGKNYISPEKVVDICTKGFYTSGHADSDENGDLWLWSDVGKTVFFSEAEAKEILKGGV